MDDSERKRATATSFDGSEDWYFQSSVHRAGADLDRIGEWCAEAGTALDVATGAGHTARALRDAGVQTIYFTDAVPAMVRRARAADAGSMGVVCDAERLPFEGESFDALTCRMAGHHFPNPATFVAEASRVLTADGLLVVEDNVAPPDDELDSFINELERRRDPTHGRSHRTATWREWTTTNGFEIEQIEHLRKPIPFQWWVDRMENLDRDDKREIRDFILEAPAAAREFFNVRIEGDDGIQFESLKMLMCARASHRD